MNKQHAPAYLAFVVLVAGILACNAPTPTSEAPPPTDTPSILPTVTPTKTVTPSPTATPIPMEETTPTATPILTTTPTVVPPPDTTPTPPPMGEPLAILDPGYEMVYWQRVPDTDDWEGYLRVIFTGGVEPYTFAIERGPEQSENHLYVRWRKCHSAPLTVSVFSADGQEAHKAIWVVSPWCPD